MRRLSIALAAVGTVAALIAGCSSAKQSTDPLPEAATLVQDAGAATKDLKSVHLVLAVDGQVKNMPVRTLEGDLTNQPATAAKGNATITFMGSDVDVKFVVLGGDLYAAMSGDDFDNFGPAEKIYDVAAILDPDKGLANVLANFTDAKTEGRETLNKQSTVRISGMVPPDAVNKLAPQLKATEPMASTVWVQDSGDHQLVRAKLTPGQDNALQMTLSNWNDPVTVDMPAGA